MLDVGGGHALVDGSGVSDDAGAQAHEAREELTRHALAGIQRERIVVAITQVAAARGAGSVTVADVVGAAGLSRRTFYEVFDDAEQALLAALDTALARARARALPAYESGGSWRERIRAGLYALIALFDEQPDLARLLLVESLAAGPAALARRGETLRLLARTLESTRPKAERAGAMTAEGVIGAVLSILHAHVSEDRPGALVELLNTLMSIVVLPYAGAAAARAELEEPLPRRARARAAPQANPLADTPMRLTYRTVRVLRAIAVKPGASNRQIGQEADVTDQGQMSKLLRRLQRLELIANMAPPVRGAANEWQLQPLGEQVLRATGSWPDAGAPDG